ncbi:MAG: DUF1206 domain-containing protein [Pseudonocardiales bacterium]
MQNVDRPGGTAGTAPDEATSVAPEGTLGVWLRAVCRLGLVCRGTVYILVGYLALRLALAAHGRKGAPASGAGAVQAVTTPGWARVVLILLVVGLGAYALTQLIEAVYRPAHATSTIGKWRQRAVSSLGCLLYTAFSVSAAWPLVASRPKQTAQSEREQDVDLTAELLRAGWGRPLLLLIAVLLVAAGVEVGRRSVRLDFRERFFSQHMPGALATITRALGACGCAARSVVFVLVGVFLFKAAVLSDAQQTKGLDAVFRSVASPAYGTWLLATLALGLICYGLYCMIEARYRDLTPGM